MCFCLLFLFGASFPLHLGYRARSAPSAKRKSCIQIEDKIHKTNFDHLLNSNALSLIPRSVASMSDSESEETLKFVFYNLSEHVLNIETCGAHLLGDEAGGCHSGRGVDLKHINSLTLTSFVISNLRHDIVDTNYA